jgi:hypothetical protein
MLKVRFFFELHRRIAISIKNLVVLPPILRAPRLGLSQEDSISRGTLFDGKGISIGYPKLDVPVQDSTGELGDHFLRDVLPLESREDALNCVDRPPWKSPPS